MNSCGRYENEDPLGFTKQTATMLVGLGARDLIPQFKKRNISSQGLAALSKHDFIVLGADESLAEDMLKQLRAAAKKFGGRDLSEELRTNQLIKILTGANQQLNLIETFICYARLRLAKEPRDFIIDSNKNVRASEALCSAASCIIADVENLERNLQELGSEFSNYKTVLKSSRSRLIAFFTGIGFTACLLCAFRYAIVSTKRA